MASFCGSCGFPIGANWAFGSNCGSRQGASAAPPPPQMQINAAPVAPKSGSGLKVVMVICGCLLLGGVAAIGRGQLLRPGNGPWPVAGDSRTPCASAMTARGSKALDAAIYYAYVSGSIRDQRRSS